MPDAAVRLIRIAPSRGVAHARNRGIEMARGEWIAPLHDDFWAPGRLRKMLTVARATGADAVVSRAIVDDNGRPIRPTPGVSPAGFEANVVGGPSSVIVTRAALERSGGFDESFDVRRAASRLYLDNSRRHRRTTDLARGLLTPLGERLLRSRPSGRIRWRRRGWV